MSTGSTLFDRWSSTYDGTALQLSTYRPIHDAVLARLGDTAPSTVVDLGCGTGRLTERLVRRFPEADVIGVDLSDGMLLRAARRLAGGDTSAPAVVRADARHLPFAPRSIDVVVCTESFHWYRNQQGVLDDLAPLLRPGGRLLIASIATVTDLGDRAVRRSTRRGGNEIRALPPRRLRSLLDHSGFEVTHQRRLPRLGPVAWPVLTDATVRNPTLHDAPMRSAGALR